MFRRNRKWLLITGPMRSGTSMIAADIAKHVYKQEPRSEITPLSDVFELLRHFDHKYEELQKRDWLIESNLANEILTRALVQFQKGFSSNEKLIGKDPYLSHYPDYLQKLLDENKCEVLCVVRDPLDVISSAKEVFNKQPYASNFENWIQLIWKSYKGVEALSSNNSRSKVIVISYEAYVKNYLVSLGEIANWLELDFAFESNGEWERGIPKEHWFYSELLLNEPTPVQIGKFNTRLSEEEIKIYNERFWSVRNRLGYS